MPSQSVASLLGQPALVQLLEKSCGDKSEKDRKTLRDKIESNLIYQNLKDNILLIYTIYYIVIDDL